MTDQIAEALANGDEHLRDLDMASRSHFVPARFQWDVNTVTGALSLRVGEYL